MIVRPLSNSPDMGSAIKVARSRHQTLADGPRPRVDLTPFQGAQDLLLIRIVLGLTADADVAYILDLTPDEQVFLFVKNQWDHEGATSTLWPIYIDDPDNVYPHIERHLLLEDTGTVIVAGGRSGSPITLVSDNSAVCAITPFTVTYADLVADAPNWEDPTRIALYHPSMSIQGFTITLNAYGDTSFTLAQAGNGLYLPVEVFSGPWTFTSEPLLLDEVVLMEGGACAGGEMTIQFAGQLHMNTEGGACAGGSFAITQEGSVAMAGGACAGGTMPSFGSFAFAMSGGACVGGEMPAERSYDFAMSGGACVGGTMPSSVLNIPFPRPIATQFGPVVIPYVSRTNYPMPFSATLARAPGSTVSYRVTSLGANCSMNGALFSALGTWYGTTSFSYVAIETKNGIAMESLPVTIQVTVQAPLVAPTASFFDLHTSYAGRNALSPISLVQRVTLPRNGVMTVHVGSHSPQLTVTATALGLQVVFPQEWKDAYWINYYITETANGVPLNSAMANISIYVAKPVLPAVDFSSFFPETPAAEPWKTGQRGVFTYSGPTVGEDGEDLEMFWGVLVQPGPNLVYPNPDNAPEVELTPIDYGSYSLQLTVADSHGQSASKVRNYEVASVLPLPTLKMPIYGEIEGNTVVTFNLDVFIEKKRGGALSFQILGHTAGCEVTLVDAPGGGTNLRFEGVAAAFPSLETFTFTVTEAADGGPATSAPLTGTIMIKVPDETLYFTWAKAGDTATLNWGGGKPPYSFKWRGGDWNNMPASLHAFINRWTTAKSVTFTIGAFCITSASEFLLGDSSTPPKEQRISVQAVGVPICQDVEPPVQNPLKVTIMGYHWLRVSGGTPFARDQYTLNYNATVTGLTQGITIYTEGRTDIRTWGQQCYCPGAGVKVTDAAGTSVTVQFGTNWMTNPVCTAGCSDPGDPGDPGWTLIWTCPLKDIRTNLTWMNGPTLVAGPNCTWGYPSNQGRVTLVSPDGQWRITGDYVSTMDVNTSTYGCSILKMNLATGYNFGPASFPFCSNNTPNAGANDFLVRTLERKN